MRLHGPRIFDRSADDEEVLSSAHFSFVCQHYVRVGVPLRRNSFCINAMTIMLCHLLSRI